MTLFHRTLRAAEAIKGEDMAAVRAATRLAPPRPPRQRAKARSPMPSVHGASSARPSGIRFIRTRRVGPGKADIHRTHALCGMVGYGLRPNPPYEGASGVTRENTLDLSFRNLRSKCPGPGKAPLRDAAPGSQSLPAAKPG
jgi:hypothetical protein